MTVVKAAFRPDLVKLQLKALTTSREFHPRERKDAKYQQIAASLNAVGLIEPLVVFPADGGTSR